MTTESVPPVSSRLQSSLDLLGKPFILWLLSSVVLTSFGWAVSKAQSEWEQTSRRKESIRRLDTELSTRLANARDELQVLIKRTSEGQYASLNSAFAKNFARPCLNGQPTTKEATGCDGVYPEWSNRTFQSLLIELHSLVPQEEKNELREVQAAVRKFVLDSWGPYVANRTTTLPDSVTISRTVAVAEDTDKILRETVSIPRWSQ